MWKFYNTSTTLSIERSPQKQRNLHRNIFYVSASFSRIKWPLQTLQDILTSYPEASLYQNSHWQANLTNVFPSLSPTLIFFSFVVLNIFCLPFRQKQSASLRNITKWEPALKTITQWKYLEFHKQLWFIRCHHVSLADLGWFQQPALFYPAE